MFQKIREVAGATSHGRRRLYATGALTLVAKCSDSIAVPGAQARVGALTASPGLVAAYSFDEGTGSTVSDTSGSGNAGTVSNTTWSSAGRFGGALSFNGTSLLVKVPDSALIDLAGGMTLEAWVKPGASMASSWQAILVKEQTQELVYGLYVNSSHNVPAAIVYRGGEKTVYGTTQSPANAWHFIAATYDASTVRIYLDGTLVGSFAASGNMLASSGRPQHRRRLGLGRVVPGPDRQRPRLLHGTAARPRLQSDMVTPVTPGSAPDTQARRHRQA